MTTNKVYRSVVEKIWKTKAGFKAAVVLTYGRHRCGYVAIPVGHPLYKVRYNEGCKYLLRPDDSEPVGTRGAISLLLAAINSNDESPTMDWVFDVHGGITFSNNFIKSEKDTDLEQLATDEWWIGFDCAHAGDGKIQYEEDTCYQYNYPGDVIRSKEYVESHCESLASQILKRCISQTLLIEDKEF